MDSPAAGQLENHDWLHHLKDQDQLSPNIPETSEYIYTESRLSAFNRALQFTGASPATLTAKRSNTHIRIHYLYIMPSDIYAGKVGNNA